MLLEVLMTETFLAPDTVVLIVEDQPIIAASLEASLNEFGAAEIHIARNLDLAVSIVDRRVPTLAIIDLHWEKEALETLLARLRAFSVGIVLVTDYRVDRDVAAAGGGEVAIEKPFGDQILQAAVSKALSMRKSRPSAN
jgi:DNA-binding response OmpR family regulator